jgi:hypothetical protein
MPADVAGAEPLTLLGPAQVVLDRVTLRAAAYCAFVDAHGTYRRFRVTVCPSDYGGALLPRASRCTVDDDFGWAETVGVEVFRRPARYEGSHLGTEPQWFDCNDALTGPRGAWTRLWTKAKRECRAAARACILRSIEGETPRDVLIAFYADAHERIQGAMLLVRRDLASEEPYEGVIRNQGAIIGELEDRMKLLEEIGSRLGVSVRALRGLPENDL